MSKVPSTEVFESRLRAPSANGPFVLHLNNLGEACFLDLVTHELLHHHRLAEHLTRANSQLAALIEAVTGADGAVIAFRDGTQLRLFEIAARSEMAVRMVSLA